MAPYKAGGEWDIPEGGWATKWLGTVSDASFEEGDYGIQLCLTIAIEEVYEPEGVESDSKKAWYGCGKGWRVLRGGQAVEHEKGAKSFQPSSKMARLVRTLAKEMGVAGDDWGSPRQASTWKGRRFVWEEIEEVEQVQGVERTIRTVLPREYRPVGKAASATRPASPPRPARPARPASPDDLTEGDIELLLGDILGEWLTLKQVIIKCAKHQYIRDNSLLMDSLDNGLLDRLVSEAKVLADGDMYISVDAGG